MWNDDIEFPSVEDRDEDYVLPDHDEEWLEMWRETTHSLWVEAMLLDYIDDAA